MPEARKAATVGMSRPPGPAGWPVLGNWYAVTTNLFGLLEGSMHEYGDIFHVPVGPHHSYVVSNPDFARHVLVTNAANYCKGRMFGKIKDITGEGVFTSEGELWRRQRRIMQPQFHHDLVRPLGTLMVETIRETIERLRPVAERGDVIDLVPEMSRMTANVVSRALFSDDIDRETTLVSDALTVALERIHERFYAIVDLTDVVPTRRNRRYHRALSTLRGIVLRIIQQRRASGVKKADLLQLLLDAKDAETGESMSDQQLRDEVMTLFLAGHETTASVLSWAWYLLARNPVVDRILRQEIAQAVGDRTPAIDDVPRLTYPRQVFEEALRLYPAVQGIPRDALADDVIGGYHIPAGSTVTVSAYLVHRNPQFWPSPDGFDPDRFAAAQPRRHPFAYLPFGAGSRRCLGQGFAVLEGTLAITMIAQAYRPELVAGFAVKPAPRATLQPESVHVRLRGGMS